MCSSSSTVIDFKRVKVDEYVDFKFTSDSPKIGTMDMAYWYLVAIVPNSKLVGVKIDEWKSPIDINNNLKEVYKIKIHCQNFNLRDSLSIVEEHVNNIGNIEIENYYYSSANSDYLLLSYDEDSTNKLIERINNMNTNLKASLLYSEHTIINKLVDNKYYKISNDDYDIKPIVKILKPDKNEDYGGHLRLTYNDFTIDSFEKSLSTIQQYENDWNLNYYEISVHWIN